MSGVELRGPFFQGNPARRLKDNIRQMLEEVADFGEDAVTMQLQPGHGYDEGDLADGIDGRVTSDYRASVGVRPGSDKKEFIKAQWVSTGRRRGKQTKFKGYRIFRKARGEIYKRRMDFARRVTDGLS